MGQLAKAACRIRPGCRRAVGALLGLVLVLGALDVHDPKLCPVVYATPTPVPPRSECGGGCEHVEEGTLLTPDHQPATQPAGKVRLLVSRIGSPAAPEAAGRCSAAYAAPPPGPQLPRPVSTRAPPLG